MGSEPIFEYQKNDDASGTVVLTATMEKDWVIYSQHTAEGGPLPTLFDWHENADYSYLGSVEELSTPIKAFSEMFSDGINLRG